MIKARNDPTIAASTGQTLLVWFDRGGDGVGGFGAVGSIVGRRLRPDLSPPLGPWSVIGWLVAALLFCVALRFRESRISQSPTAILIVLVSLELFGASLFLPVNRATAPGALTSLRPAVAHLLAQADATVAGPPARFLSISDIFFDPGDKPEIEIALEPQLSADALYDYIIATKQKEVLIPNLPLYYRLPAMDGYDGGVLPLRRYVTLERLYMPQEQVAPDGRLRENLDSVPDGRWLNLFNVRFVVTDKVGDAWFDGVFYDLQMETSLRAAQEAAVGYVPPVAATALGVVYRADGAQEGTPLAQVELALADGRQVSLSLLADAAGSGDRVARFSWGRVGTPLEIGVRGLWDARADKTGLLIRGLSLIDERTGVFQALVLSASGRYRLVHSGDVKIYENLDVLPRLFFVPQAIAVPDDEAALAVMRDPAFDPAITVVLANESNLQALTTVPPFGAESLPKGPRARVGGSGTPDPQSEILLYEPEHVVATVTAPAEGWLVLSDAWYPGWEATLDGEPVSIERADILFRAVKVAAGEHRVEWIYRPLSLRLGVAISSSALAVLLVWVGWSLKNWSSERLLWFL